MSTASLRQLLYDIPVCCATFLSDLCGLDANLCFTALRNSSLSANTLGYVHICCLSELFHKLHGGSAHPYRWL
jgi:hypothetical protein